MQLIVGLQAFLEFSKMGVTFQYNYANNILMWVYKAVLGASIIQHFMIISKQNNYHFLFQGIEMTQHPTVLKILT